MPATPRLAFGQVATYAAPAAAVGFMVFLVQMYLMKYATDVLLIPPAAMGLIFVVSRVWDAVSDPLAGYLSDATRSRWGRRRPWLVFSALPVGAIYVLLWNPLDSLGSTGVVLWLGVAVVLFYTGFTAFDVPHSALGAELTPNYRDRNRIFGMRRVCFGLGALAAIAAMSAMAGAADAPAARRAALVVSLAAGGLAALLMLYTGFRVHEPPEHQGRGAQRPFSAWLDIVKNRHARLLLTVFATQQLGVGALSIITPYYAQYVLGSATAVGTILGAFMVASIASVPLWVAAGRRFEKKPLLLVAMTTIALAIGSLAFVSEGQVWLAATLAAVGGVAGGGADVFFPSVQSDVIDYDEYVTGERKEGVYFAGWAFASKSAGALAGLITGVALQLSGFEPNAEQSESARRAIVGLMGGLPVFFYTVGLLLFLRFDFDEQTHARVQREIEARR
jgi:GPH family glycoside/pentoside/hexuronide:cation symporter